jgi:hypothetical protein
LIGRLVLLNECQVGILNTAYCYAMLGNAAEAEVHFEQILRELPDDGNATFGLQMVRMRPPAQASSTPG